MPATSTQGVIAEADKAKQARDGVQLVRLSFPPTIDVDAVCDAVISRGCRLRKSSTEPVRKRGVSCIAVGPCRKVVVGYEHVTRLRS